MPGSKFFPVFLALLTAVSYGSFAFAQAVASQHTIGIRAAALTIQQIIATPPLPSLDADSKWHLSVQGAYVTGTMERHTIDDGFEQRFSGKPEGYAAGLGYTSSSRGRYSHFVMGVISKSKADVGFIQDASTPNFRWDVKDTDIMSGVLGAGFNYVLLGSLHSKVALGIFGGGLLFANQTKYKFAYQDTSTSVYGSNAISSDSTNYGPMAGLQLKLDPGLISLTPYGYYYHDISNHCLDYKADGQPFKCLTKLNYSFWTAGVMLGIERFRFGYSLMMQNKIDTSDTKLRVWQLSYTFDF